MHTTILSIRTILGALLVLSLMLAAASPAAAQLRYKVTSTEDTGDADRTDGACADANKECTLRAAIDQAQDQMAVIHVPAEHYKLVRTLVVGKDQVIKLVGDGVNKTVLSCDTGQMNIYGYLEIAAFTITECPTTTNRGTFWVKASEVTDHPETAIYNHGSMTINDVTFRGNGNPEYPGGAVRNAGITTMLAVRFYENRALSGGAISNAGDLVVGIGTFEGNSADNSGGAIYNSDEGVLKFETVRFSRNEAQMGGGLGNFSSGHSELRQVSFTDNRAQDGGAFFNRGHMHFLNTTFSQNEAGAYGGGLSTDGGELLLSNVTITQNRAVNGGGISVNKGTVQMGHTILAQNEAAVGPDCNGDLGSEGYNLLGKPDDCALSPQQNSDQIGRKNKPLDPKLEPLASGTYTAFHGLQKRSPALDEGDPNGCFDVQGKKLSIDQLEIPRPMGKTCDVGAIEIKP